MGTVVFWYLDLDILGILLPSWQAPLRPPPMMVRGLGREGTTARVTENYAQAAAAKVGKSRKYFMVLTDQLHVFF